MTNPTPGVDKRPKLVHCKKAPYDIYIGRPSFWGNPYHIGPDGDRDEVIQKYKEYVRSSPIMMRKLQELVGNTLGCWCMPKRCHGEALIELMEEEGLI